MANFKTPKWFKGKGMNNLWNSWSLIHYALLLVYTIIRFSIEISMNSGILVISMQNVIRGSFTRCLGMVPTTPTFSVCSEKNFDFLLIFMFLNVNHSKASSIMKNTNILWNKNPIGSSKTILVSRTRPMPSKTEIKTILPRFRIQFYSFNQKRWKQVNT